MFHADNGRRPLVLEQSFITRAGGFIHRHQEFFAVGFQFRQFLFQILLAFGQIRNLDVHALARLPGGLVCRRHFLLGQFRLLHPFDLLVVELHNRLFALFNLVGQGAVLVIFLGLKLLQGILLNQPLLCLDLQFQLFAFGFNMFAAVFRGIQAGLRSSRPRNERLALRFHVGQLILYPDDVAVAVLENQKFFNCVGHALIQFM